MLFRSSGHKCLLYTEQEQRGGVLAIVILGERNEEKLDELMSYVDENLSISAE